MRRISAAVMVAACLIGAVVYADGEPWRRRQRPAQDQAEEAADKALDRRIGPINFDRKPFGDALSFLGTLAPIYTDWPSLRAAGVSPEKAISLELSDIPLRQALSLMLKAVAPSDDKKPEFRNLHGVIVISMSEQRDYWTTAMAQTVGQAGRDKAAATLAMIQTLQKTASVASQEQPLEKVLASVSGQPSDTLAVDCDGLAKHGITKTSSISLALKEVRRDLLVALVLGQAGLRHGVALEYWIAEGKLHIGVKRAAATRPAKAG